MKQLFLLLAFLFTMVAANAQPCPEIDNKKALKLYDDALARYKKSKSDYRNILEEAVNVEPDFALAYDSLARSWYFINKTLDFSRDNYRKAVEYFSKAVAICPDVDPFAYYVIGRMDLFNSDFDNAAINFKKFLAYEKRTDMEFKINDYDLDSAEFFFELADFNANVKKKPVPFNPTPVPNISTDNGEYLGALTPDNEVMYFTRNLTESSMTSLTGPKEVEKFCFAKQQADGSFDKGKPMLLPFNKPGRNEGGPSSTIDNKTLYFTICDPAGSMACDIYFTHFAGGEWSEPKPLPGVNLPEFWDSQPSVSSDGNTIYFASDRPGGLGGVDIYKIEKQENGNWGKPINLGPTINTEYDDKSPFFHTDGQTLYFSSEGHENISLGGFDIFFSKLDTAGKFSKPKNIGYPINTEDNDLGFFCSTDGRLAFFATSRFARNGVKGRAAYDIMQFDLYAGARPEKVMFIKGQLKDDNNQPVKNAIVEIKSVDVKQKPIKVNVDSTSGMYVAAVTLKTDYIMTVQQPGSAFTSHYISKNDTVALAKPKKVDLEVKPVAVGKAYTLNNIYFDVNAYDLSAQSKVIIGEFGKFLKDNANIKVAIQGHTDDVGPDAENLKLSDNRAKAVYDFLISIGVPAERISYKGFGETKPLLPNTTEANRAKNRRTEFVIIAK